MLLIATALVQAGEPALARPDGAYRLELERIDAPAPTSELRLGTLWQQPQIARLAAGTAITAGGLALTLMMVREAPGPGVPGDLVPGRAALTGGALLLGGGVLWLTTDASAAGSGLQKGLALRGVW